MSRFKKIALTLILGLMVFSLLNFSSALAKEPTPEQRLKNVGLNAGFPEISEPSNFLPQMVGQIIKAFLALLGIIFMGYLLYAGYLWMTARGNEEQIIKSKAIIRGSIIGLIITISAYIITATVIDRLTKASGLKGASSGTTTGTSTK